MSDTGTNKPEIRTGHKFAHQNPPDQLILPMLSEIGFMTADL
jgi:hypothetical protein